MKNTSIVAYLSILLAIPLSASAQHDISIYNKKTETGGSNAQTANYPWYMYNGPVFLDFRYNFDWDKTTGLFAGKSFGTEKFSVVPTLGTLFGPNYKSMSPQIYFMGKGETYSYTLLNQYSVGYNGSNDYVYNWYEVYALKPTSFLELGATQQTFYEYAEGSEPQMDIGPGARLTIGKTYWKVWYAISPTQADVSKLYLTAGASF